MNIDTYIIIAMSIFTNIKMQKQAKITDYYKIKKIYGYNTKTCDWHCLECGISMGKNNPRQLCAKYYCSEKQ